jgi:uncharacterized membrane protein HdeD (DUF308 family)
MRLYRRATRADDQRRKRKTLWQPPRTSLRSSAEPNRMYREDEFNDSNRTSRLLQAERYAMSEIQTLDVRIPAEIIHNWGWFLAFGIGLALLGILAIVRAVAATVVSMLFFGWLLVIAAGIEIVQAIMVGKWAGLFQHWLGAVLFGVIGILILWRPLVTAEILTLLMGAFFLVAGLFQLITPFVISLPDWGWHTLNGLITLLLGILVLAQWPVSGLWVIGLFVGIELVFYGVAWIALALDLRSLA